MLRILKDILSLIHHCLLILIGLKTINDHKHSLIVTVCRPWCRKVHQSFVSICWVEPFKVCIRCLRVVLCHTVFTYQRFRKELGTHKHNVCVCVSLKSGYFDLVIIIPCCICNLLGILALIVLHFMMSLPIIDLYAWYCLIIVEGRIIINMCFIVWYLLSNCLVINTPCISFRLFLKFLN